MPPRFIRFTQDGSTKLAYLVNNNITDHPDEILVVVMNIGRVHDMKNVRTSKVHMVYFPRNSVEQQFISRDWDCIEAEVAVVYVSEVLYGRADTDV